MPAQPSQAQQQGPSLAQPNPAQPAAQPSPAHGPRQAQPGPAQLRHQGPAPKPSPAQPSPAQPSPAPASRTPLPQAAQAKSLKSIKCF